MLTQDGHILDEKCKDLLALAVDDGRISPELWQVAAERTDAILHVDAQLLLGLGTEVCEVFLGRRQLGQACVPLRFEACGNQTIGWINQHEASAGGIALVTRAGDLQLMMLFALPDAAIQLVLDCQRHLDGHRGHELENQAGGCGIDIRCRNALARGTAGVGLIHADITRSRPVSMNAAITDIHRAATAPTHHATLQQRWPFTRRTECVGSAKSLHIAAQLRLDGFELGP
jgi:hypothetical protein